MGSAAEVDGSTSSQPAFAEVPVDDGAKVCGVMQLFPGVLGATGWGMAFGLDDGANLCDGAACGVGVMLIFDVGWSFLSERTGLASTTCVEAVSWLRVEHYGQQFEGPRFHLKSCGWLFDGRYSPQPLY